MSFAEIEAELHRLSRNHAVEMQVVAPWIFAQGEECGAWHILYGSGSASRRSPYAKSPGKRCISTAWLRLSPEELRALALKSWTTFVAKEAGAGGLNKCDETELRLSTDLDEALARADATSGQGYSGQQVSTRLNEWISK